MTFYECEEHLESDVKMGVGDVFLLLPSPPSYCDVNVTMNFRDLPRHFNTEDFEHMGRVFCETVLEYQRVKGSNE